MAPLIAATLDALAKSLPPAPDRIELHVHPNSYIRYPQWFAVFDKANKPLVSALGTDSKPIRVTENKYVPVDWGVAENHTRGTYTPVRYAEDYP